MRIAMTLTVAAFALAISAHSASAQRTGGGTIGCDPGLPTAMTSATQCRTFFKEELYGPCANPYAASWQSCASAPVVRQKTYKKRSKHKSSTSGGAY